MGDGDQQRLVHRMETSLGSAWLSFMVLMLLHLIYLRIRRSASRMSSHTGDGVLASAGRAFAPAT